MKERNITQMNIERAEDKDATWAPETVEPLFIAQQQGQRVLHLFQHLPAPLRKSNNPQEQCSPGETVTIRSPAIHRTSTQALVVSHTVRIACMNESFWSPWTSLLAFTIVLFIIAIPVVSEFPCCGFVLHQVTKDTRHLFVCKGQSSFLHEVLRTQPLGM